MRVAMLKLFHSPGRLYPKRVFGKSFAASIRHKTNDLFVPIHGIGLASSEGISPSLGIAKEPCRFVLTRSMTLFTLVERQSTMDGQLSEVVFEPLSLMTYSHDGYGLVHLRRNTNIAAKFVQEAPGSSVLMLTGCPPGNPLLLPKGVDFIKVPSLIKVDTGVYAPLGLRISRQKAKAIRASVIQSAIIHFKPNLLLVDHVPSGTYGELLPTLGMLNELDEPPVIVLGLRDIIDAPDVVCELCRKEMTYQTIRKYYDEVLVYGCKDIFDSALHYGLLEEFRGRVRYSGYVCSPGPVKSREQVRADLRLRRQSLVVVTTGGGHDGYPFMQSCLDAIHLIGRNARFEAVFITGPLVDPDPREHLRTRARALGARRFTVVDDAPSFRTAAGLCLPMAGSYFPFEV